MEKKTRLQIIGAYLDQLDEYLLPKNIVIENKISRPSPLAMEGSQNDALTHFCEEIDDCAVALNVRKNLKQMLSHSEDNFCDNNLMPFFAKEVRYKNDTEYLVVINSYLALALYDDGTNIYSDLWPQNSFTEYLKSDKSMKCYRFPFPEQFNWKLYYDRFIDAIISEYDHKHIILIRVNSAQWYMNENEITRFEDRSIAFRNAVEEFDNYFIERTNCYVIDDLYSQIPDSYVKGAFPYEMINRDSYKKLADSIAEIIEGNYSDYSNKANNPVVGGNPFVKFLGRRFSRKKLKEIIKEIDYIEKQWLTNVDLYIKSESKHPFLSDAKKLKIFLYPKNTKRLSDYLNEETPGMVNDDEIREIISLYIDYFRIDINDIIAVYEYYKKCGNKAGFKSIISKIVQSADHGPVRSSIRFFEMNLRCLKEYGFISDELKKIPKPETVYITLGNNNFLLLDPYSDEPMKQVVIEKNNEIDYMKIADNDYVCSLSEAESICENWKLYIEKGRRSEGSKPFKIVYKSKEEFLQSLFYLDYTELLENESFVLTLDPDQFFEESKAKTDLDFLFRPNVKICSIEGGLGDQTCFYLFIKILSEHMSNFDDIYYYDNTARYFNGREFDRFINDDINDRLISNLVSKKLLAVAKGGIAEFGNTLYDNGMSEMTAFLGGFAVTRAERFHCSRVLVEDLSVFPLVNSSSLSLYWSLIRPDEMMQLYDFKLSDYIKFPEFDTDKNKEISQKMLSSDSIAIHIRRGDLIRLGRADDSSFSRDAIKKLLEIPEYTNKKWFIFSDSIPYCRQHPEEFGLDLIKNDEIIFVDNNKYEDSFRDMQLMTYCKVIVGGNSAYPRLAATYSDKCEVYLSSRTNVMELFKKIGRKNKYDVE